MKKTTDSSTLHNSFVKGSQENLQENVTGANSLPTQAPTEFDKSVIVQSSPDEFDAVAKAERKIIKTKYRTFIENKVPLKFDSEWRWCYALSPERADYYNDWTVEYSVKIGYL